MREFSGKSSFFKATDKQKQTIHLSFGSSMLAEGIPAGGFSSPKLTFCVVAVGGGERGVFKVGSQTQGPTFKLTPAETRGTLG